MELGHERNRLSVQPKPIQGLRVPLFDRLVDSAPEVQMEHAPFRVYGKAALFASIARDLARLMNTRRTTLDSSVDLTVLNYGVPGFSHLSATDDLGNRALAETIRLAIQRFEPRLQEIAVVLERDPRNTLQLLGSISGKVSLGSYTEPITFSLLRPSPDGELEVLAPEILPPNAHE